MLMTKEPTVPRLSQTLVIIWKGLFKALSQPGLIKIRTFSATPFYVPYCTFRHSFTEKCPLSGAKTQVKYVKPGKFLLRRYRYILLCFYYIDTEMFAAVQN